MLCMTDGSKGASVRVIRELRDAKGWSQTELEARSGVPQTLISRMELGKIANPGVNNVRAIARALGVPMSRLTGDAADDADVQSPRTSEPSTLEAAVLLVPGLSRFDLRAFDAARAAAREAGDVFVGHDQAQVAARLLHAAQELLEAGKPPTTHLVFARAFAAQLAPEDAKKRKG